MYAVAAASQREIPRLPAPVRPPAWPHEEPCGARHAVATIFALPAPGGSPVPAAWCGATISGWRIFPRRQVRSGARPPHASGCAQLVTASRCNSTFVDSDATGDPRTSIRTWPKKRTFDAQTPDSRRPAHRSPRHARRARRSGRESLGPGAVRAPSSSALTTDRTAAAPAADAPAPSATPEDNEGPGQRERLGDILHRGDGRDSAAEQTARPRTPGRGGRGAGPDSTGIWGWTRSRRSRPGRPDQRPSRSRHLSRRREASVTGAAPAASQSASTAYHHVLPPLSQGVDREHAVRGQS